MPNFWARFKNSRIFNLLGHVLVLSGLFLWWFPVIHLYFKRVPQIGCDYFQFPGYVKYLIDHFSLPINSWRYIWYSGLPAVFDNQWLHFYLAMPLVKFFGLFHGVEIYMLAALFLYLVFAYLLFFELSKSKILAFALTFSITWAYDAYIALFNGGGSNFSATQLFLPLVLWLIVKYFHSQNRKYFYLAAILAGLSFWGHAGLALFFVLIPASLVILSWWSSKEGFINLIKIKNFGLFFVLSLSIGLIASYFLIKLSFTNPFFMSTNQSSGKAIPDALVTYFSTANYFVLLSPALLFVFVIAKRNYSLIKNSLSFIVPLLYMVFFEYLYTIAKNPLRENILNDRTYWVITILAGALLSILWNVFRAEKSISEKVKFKNVLQLVLLKILNFVFILSLLISPFVLGQKLNLQEETLRFTGIAPFAMYDILLKGEESKMSEIIPAWFDRNEMNYRFYNKEPSIAYWWSLENKIPLSHGNYNSQNQAATNWSYWLDLVVSGEMHYKYGFPVDISKNQAKFLLDWYAIKYMEGIETDVNEGWKPQGIRVDYKNKKFWLVSGSPDSQISTYLTNDPDIFSKEEMTALKDFEIAPGVLSEIESNLGRKLTEDEKKFGELYFYEVKDEATSHLVVPTNAPTMLVVGNDIGYDGIIRSLASSNINSKSLIPIRGPESLADLSHYKLTDFDAIFLYNYKSENNNQWRVLSDYVSHGGTVIVDTGSEVRESDLSKLPEIFPIQSTKRAELGKNWQINESKENEIVKGIDFNSLSKLEYEGGGWKLSFSDNEQVKSSAEIILDQKDLPILVSQKIGQGKIIWSGINLPYRIQYHRNLQEIKLFNNLIENIINIHQNQIQDFKFNRLNPENITVEGNNFKGVLFKENWDSGWKAKIISDRSKKTSVYKAGPDFMYVRTPQNNSGNVKVQFHYRGSGLAWFLSFLSFGALLWALKYIIWPKRIFPANRFSNLQLNQRVQEWWTKEENE